MSARKKTWTKSAFSQLEETLLKEAESTPSKVARASTPTEAKRSVATRAKSTEISQNNNVSIQPLAALTANWIEAFAPTKPDELAVHAKKLAELQEWLQYCQAMRVQKPAQICLITGPTGAGKTAAAKVLAHASNYYIKEWINPIDKDQITMLGEQTCSYVGSQVAAFKSFLLLGSRYKSLWHSNEKQLLLVEDLPNALLGDSTAFHDILEDFLNSGKSPLIFVVADSKSRQLNISNNLFADEIKNKLCIKHISFNAIASTLMHNAMKRFCALLKQAKFSDVYRLPAPAVIDSIVLSAQGDIRNALINLHFASLKGAPGLQTQLMMAPAQPSKARAPKKQYTLKSIGRDESITVFHVLGRIFNPKFSTEKTFVHSPESLVDLVSTEPKKIVNFIHANYMDHFADIESLLLASDGMSLADVILQDYREEQLGVTALNVAIRSVMVANSAPVTGWRPVRGAKRYTVAQPTSLELSKYELRQNMSRTLYAAEYSTYIKCIGKQKTHTK